MLSNTTIDSTGLQLLLSKHVKRLYLLWLSNPNFYWLYPSIHLVI
jgi:hypothetical protein